MLPKFSISELQCNLVWPKDVYVCFVVLLLYYFCTMSKNYPILFSLLSIMMYNRLIEVK